MRRVCMRMIGYIVVLCFVLDIVHVVEGTCDAGTIYVGCPNGWTFSYNARRCYMLVTDQPNVNADQARAICRSKGGNLFYSPNVEGWQELQGVVLVAQKNAWVGVRVCRYLYYQDTTDSVCPDATCDANSASCTTCCCLADKWNSRAQSSCENLAVMPLESQYPALIQSYGTSNCVAFIDWYGRELQTRHCSDSNGFYALCQINNPCSDCAAGKYSYADQWQCTDCVAGKSSAAVSGSCAACGAGKSSTKGGLCTSCTAGKYSHADQGLLYTQCVDCAAGKSSAAESSLCKTCDAGKYSIRGGLCTSCAAGEYQHSSTHTTCFACLSLSNSPEQSSSSTACTCNAGSSGANGGICTECTVGKYKVSPGSTGCVSCGGGRYSTVASATTADTCQQCAAGKWSGAIGASAAGTCVDCAAGMWSDVVGASANTCQICAIGKYSSTAGSATNTCANCPADSYAGSEGASACVACKAGGGTSHTSKPTGNSFCSSCDLGFYRESADGPPCDACAPGKFGLSIGLTTCTACAAGWYSTVSGATTPAVCQQCGVATFSTAGATVCIDCPPGSYGTDVGASACQKCNDLPRPRRLYQPSAGQTSCIQCNEMKEISNYNRTLCFSCLDGEQENPDSATCPPCLPGKYSDASTDRICTACRNGTYAKEYRSSTCTNCPACPDSFYRALCTPTAGGGNCSACPLCPRDQVRVDCLNRAGHSDMSGVCRPRAFMVKTALCDESGAGMGLGGYGFASLFGMSQDMAPFQCRRRCDGETNVMTADMAAEPALLKYKAQGVPGNASYQQSASFDSGYCKGPFACDVHSCVILNPSNDWDAAYLAASACPVHIDAALEQRLWAAPDDATLLAAIKSMRSTRCSSCERCGYDRPSAADSDAMHAFATWGAGCVRECTETLCGNDEVWDWTEGEVWKKCKPCAALSDVRLCPTKEQQYFVASDVSGNLPKIFFDECHGKSTNTLTNRLEATYGSCVACPLDENSIVSGEYYSTCRWDDEDKVLTAVPAPCRMTTGVNSYYFDGTADRKVYCQKPVCGQDRTGVTVDVTPHRTCNRRCRSVLCVSGQVLLPCVLPHYARCVSALSDNVQDQAYVAYAHSPGHANLLEAVSGRHLFSSFENVLLSVDSIKELERRVCVWNADDIVDNDMNPGGVSVAFNGECRKFPRDPATAYPLLPLQNTVLNEDGSFYRRLLLNTSAVAAHYSSEWRGMPREYGKSSIAGAFSGDVFLDLDLINTTNATLAAFVPDDRGLAAVTSISRWRVSVYAQQTRGEPSLVRIDTDTGVRVCDECFAIVAVPDNDTLVLKATTTTAATTTPTRTTTTTPALTTTPAPTNAGTRPATVTCSANNFSGCLCQPSSGTSSGVISVDTSSRHWDTSTGNKFCQWTIASDGIINLTFTSFSTEWASDFVIVRSCTLASCTGVNQRLIAQLSGSESAGLYGRLGEDITRPPVRLETDALTTMYTSNTGYMRVEFTADPYTWGDGVSASWYTSTRIIQPPTTTTVACSSTSAWSQCQCQPSNGLSSGQISLNTASQGSTWDGNCRWTIASDGIIRLSFMSFGSQYAADYVTVKNCTDPSCISSQIIAKLSGSSQGVYGMQADGGLGVLGIDALTTIYTSSTGYMQVEFTSDYYVFFDGFVASWCTAGITAPACTLPPRPSSGPNATVTCSAANAWSASACQCTPSAGTSSGVISANTASGTFHSDTNCQWTINVRFGGIIRLSFKSFDTEKRIDYVTVKSCIKPSCEDYVYSKIIAKLSGNSWPGIGVYGTTTHEYLDPTEADGGMDDLESEALTTTYNSSTGYMQVELTTDIYGWRAGFTAWWCTVSSPDETCTYTPPARAIAPPATTTTTTTPTPAPAECTGTGRVQCDGYRGCLCEPSDGISSGVISDGDGAYQNNRDCVWYITSSDVISLSFKSLDTENGFDYVILESCSDMGCVNIVQLSGSNSTGVYGSKADGRMADLGPDTLTAKYTADGHMSVIFQTDDSEVRDGFTASVCFIQRTTTTPAPPGITTTPAPTTPAPPLLPNTTGTVTCSGECLCEPSSGTSSGVISDGPGTYPDSALCSWIIASGGTIHLLFTSFDTERSRDYVAVSSCTDQSCTSRTLIVELSGMNGDVHGYTGGEGDIRLNLLDSSTQVTATTYTSTTGYMRVRFRPYEGVVRNGFTASWSINVMPTPIPPPTGNVTCSGGCLCEPSSKTSSGVISDGPSNYNNLRTCSWTIASSNTINLVFTMFDTERILDKVGVRSCTTLSCTSTRIIVLLSGSTAVGLYGMKADGILGVLDSDVLTTMYTSTTGYMKVTFYSDNSNVRPGFTASWSISVTTPIITTPIITTPIITTTPTPTAGLSGTVTCSGGCLCQPSSGTSSGVISDGPGDYSGDAVCNWTIASGGTINILFTSFVTEGEWDFVFISSCTDQSCTSPTIIAKLSGRDPYSYGEVADASGVLQSVDYTYFTLINRTYTSTTGYMQVKFTSDDARQRDGFTASWSIAVTTTPAPIAPTKLARTTTTPATTTPMPVPNGTLTCASTSGGAACLCQPSSQTSYGIISADLVNQDAVNCMWTIASGGIIHLSFTYIRESYKYDAIRVKSCTDASCTSWTLIAQLNGYVTDTFGHVSDTRTNTPVTLADGLATVYTSTTGYMRVEYIYGPSQNYEFDNGVGGRGQGITATWYTEARPQARRRRLLSSSITPAPANVSRCGRASYATVSSTYQKAWQDFDGDKFLIAGSTGTFACGRSMQQRVEGLGPRVSSHHTLAVHAGVVTETCDADSTYTLPISYSEPERLVGSSGVVSGLACMTVVFSSKHLYCVSADGVLAQMPQPTAMTSNCGNPDLAPVRSVVSLNDSILTTWVCLNGRLSLCSNFSSGVVTRPGNRDDVVMHASGLSQYYLSRNDNAKEMLIKVLRCSNWCVQQCDTGEESPHFKLPFSVTAENTFFSGRQGTVVMAAAGRKDQVTYVVIARNGQMAVTAYRMAEGETEVTADPEFWTRNTVMDATNMSGTWIADDAFVVSFEDPRMIWRCTVGSNITVQLLQATARSPQVPFFRVGSALLSYASRERYVLQACMPTCRPAPTDASAYFAFGSPYLNYTRLRACEDGVHYVDPSEWKAQPVHTCVSACWNASHRPMQYAVAARCKTADRFGIMALTLPPQASVAFDAFQLWNDETRNATVVVYWHCRNSSQPSRVFVADGTRCRGTCTISNQSRIMLAGGTSIRFVVEARLPPTPWDVRVMLDGSAFWSAHVDSRASLGQWSQPHVFAHALQEKQRVSVHVVRSVDYASLLQTVKTAQDTPTNVALDVLEVIPAISQRAVKQDGFDRSIILTAVRIPSDDDLARLSLLSFKAGHDVLNWRRLHAVAYLRSRESTLAGCVYTLRAVEIDANFAPTWPAPELGCALTLETMTARCHVEIPYAMANADGLVGMYVSSDNEIACPLPHPDALSVELPPFVAMQNCTEDAYLNARTGKCVSCESADKKCGVGFYAPACEALLPAGRRPNCSACDAVAHAVFLNTSKNCEDWVCERGWYKADDACVLCTTNLSQVCGRAPGRNWSACSTWTNEKCSACDELVRPRYAGWTNQSTCAWRCQAGYFETGGQCYACMGLDVLKATLQFGGARQAGTFYKFEPCNGTQQARFTPCVPAYLGNGSYTADSAAFLQHCPAVCAQDHLLHMVSSTYTDSDGLVWDAQQCVLCAHEALPIFPNGSLLQAGAFRMNLTCHAACLTAAGFHPGHARNTSAHKTVCVHCPDSKCGFGEYLRTENDCSVCHACVSRLQNNSVFTSTGRVDAEGSCTERCADGYFYDGSSDLCAPHSSRTCQAGVEYKENGTAWLDTRCVICTDCTGERERVACSAHADAQCESCGALVWWTSSWSGVDCSLQCKPSFTKLYHPAERCQRCSKCADGSIRPVAPANCSHCLACSPPKPESAVYIEECTWRCFDFHSLVESNGTKACVYNPGWLTSDRAAVAQAARKLVCGNAFRLENYGCIACETPEGLAHTTLGEEWMWTSGACAWECMPERTHFINKTTRNNQCMSMTAYREAVLRRHAVTPAVPTRVNIPAVVLVIAVLLVCFLSCGAMGLGNPAEEKGYVQVPVGN